MLRVPRSYAHLVYGVIQSGLTSAVAAAVASFDLLADGSFFTHWLWSLLVSWVLMLPIVLVAAPFVQRLTLRLTR
jgi:hypothetical protein